MKRRWIPVLLVILALPVLWGCAMTVYMQSDDPADPGDLDVSSFYDALAPYGDWIWTDAYGWVWSPYDEPVDWRPYTDGHWIWTDDGWTWVADQDWGWAPFHYGRWYDDATYGWCWVPGEEWGPAWVAWREGDGWIGWAPLPPEIGWNDDSGFDWSDWDHLPGMRHHGWSFVQEGDFPSPELQRHLAPRHRGVIRVRDTRNITAYTYAGSRVVNRSLDLDRIRRASGGDIPVYRIADIPKPPADHSRQVERGAFNAYRPRLREAPLGKAPQKVRVPRPTPAPEVIRVPEPPPTPIVPPVVRSPRERQRNEALDLQRRQDAERKDLEREVRQDTKQPPPGISPEELRRQQEDQRRALQEQVQRDQRVLEARQRQEQQQQEQQRQDQQRQEQRQQEPRVAPEQKPAPKDKEPPAKPARAPKDRAEKPDRSGDRPDRNK